MKLIAKLFPKAPPKTTDQVLSKLANAHDAIVHWKGSACRIGAARVLSLVRTHHPGIALDKVLAGRPASKIDGCPLTDQEFQERVNSVRGYATAVSTGCSTDLFYPPYDMQGNKLHVDQKKPSSLTPKVAET